MKKKTSRFLSVILVLGVLLGSTSLTLLGASAHEIDPVEMPQNNIVELTELRDDNEKHFALPDGTVEAVSYGKAIHRQNSEGEWVDINNDLTLKTVNSKRLYSTADGRVSLAEYYEKNSTLLTLNENGYSVSMSFLDNQNNHISTEDMPLTTVNNAEYTRPESFDTLQEATRIDNSVSVNYRNVINNTDLEYILSGNDIKENIIVKSRADEYEYGFLLALGGLTATLHDSGRIILADEETEEEIYVIPAPYMYDANGVYSYDVEYELIHAGGDKYLLTVTADKEWMDDAEREFPVKIDPTVYTDTYASDTYVSSASPTTNYWTAPIMQISNSTIALIDITLPTVPGLAIFDSVYLDLFFSMGQGDPFSASVHTIKNDWNVAAVTYNTKPTIETASLDTQIFNPNKNVISFDITEMMTEVYKNDLWFYGVAVKAPSAEITVNVFSADNDIGYPPRIRINYHHPSAEEQANTYYLIQNVRYEKFVQPAFDDSYGYVRDGGNLEVSDLASDAGNYQKWSIIYLDNGFYKIISKESGMALTALLEDSCLSQQTYNGGYHQQWRISNKSSGQYTFGSRSLGSNIVINVPSETEATVKATDYANTSNGSARWNLICVRKILTSVPTNLTSNTTHYCMPCSITNVAAYWCIEKNLSQFNCSTASTQEVIAIEVQAAMSAENPSGYSSHDYVQDGFDIFEHVDANGNIYTLNSLKTESFGSSLWELLVNEINSRRPVMVGFPNYDGRPHLTVCSGYEVDGTTKYLYLSDHLSTTLAKREFNLYEIDAIFYVTLNIN